MMDFKTEDVVRDEARNILQLISDKNADSNVGQLTTFNQLGFKSVSDKPDGWYFPRDMNEPALILEAKNSKQDINDKKWQAELLKNIKIVNSKYKKVIGILYNGYDVKVFKNFVAVDLQNRLFTKDYYFGLYNQTQIDKELIYRLTKNINNNLHFNFGIKNLYHRMVFTACALVAKRYGAVLQEGMNFATLRQSIISTLNTSYANERNQNNKLDLLGECFSEIRINYLEKQEAINQFILDVISISDNINSDNWNGEDVMGIFFNEFNRYKKKSEAGQILTPEHITSLMYRITGTTYKDNVLDAACGSGGFIIKAMNNMIKEVGGIRNKNDVSIIHQSKLFGIELDKEMFALSCANMLIHKDGKTNLNQGDSTTKEMGEWIKSKHITKVLMNPPFERKYGCLDIVENVLNNVEEGAICAFILPDTKLKVNKKKVLGWLKKHSLLKIIKLPKDTFAGSVNITTSIFIFKAHEPQKNKEIFACWIKEDGLETVKNMGRHDVKNKWADIENKYVQIIYKQSGDDSIQWLKPNENLSYQIPANEFHMTDSDFRGVIFKYILFENHIDEKEFKDSLLESILSKPVFEEINYEELAKLLAKNPSQDKIQKVQWKQFDIKEKFKVSTGAKPNDPLIEGNTPRISVTNNNNGIQGFFADATSDKNYRTQDNFISFSFLGTSFYHNYKASLEMKVHALKPLDFELNKYSGLFIVSVLKKLFSGNYIDQMSSSDLKEEKIYLPINNKGEINTIFMEEYIKDLYDELYNVINN